ncbi:tyrosine-type recombinase/integrase [Nocardia brasiliensis]|uniref:Tyrosine-type recombinase/integrase n=1 Tax=Nocardia brasiliensis TaxID=37326 RepID=A0A6G9Y0S8_NOCBR|nr:tyrosine-type recombinase/integrase [Nocardia brasiliensis]QIS06809.1 tyrosine-type recombinase/integrase [Nocardia brasiliensis]
MAATSARKEKFKTPGKTRRRDHGNGGDFMRKGAWVRTIVLREILGKDWEPEPGGLGGKRGIIEVSAKDRAECKAKYEAKVADIRRLGGTPLANGETVLDLMQYWLDHIKKPEIDPTTLGSYQSVINCQIGPSIGHIDRNKLTSAHVRFMHQYVLDEGRSTRTAQVAYDRLSQAWGDLAKEVPPKVRVNPCAAVRRPKADSKVRDTHTAEQARQVLLTARRDRLLTRWAVAYIMPVRQGEALGLEDDRIDLDKMVIDFSWQLKRLPLKKGADPDDPDRFDVRKGYVHRPVYRGHALAKLKSKKPKLIPIPDPLGPLFEQYLRVRPANEHGLTWVGTDGHPIDAADDLEAWYSLLARADTKAIPVPEIVLHGARHTGNALLQELGVPEDVRMQILGQSTVTAQRAYQHLSMAAAREALGNLGVLLEPA